MASFIPQRKGDLSSDLLLVPLIGQTQSEAREQGACMKRFIKVSFLQHREGQKMDLERQMAND